jgi:hypothetical protein
LFKVIGHAYFDVHADFLSLYAHISPLYDQVLHLSV